MRGQCVDAIFSWNRSIMILRLGQGVKVLQSALFWDNDGTHERGYKICFFQIQKRGKSVLKIYISQPFYPSGLLVACICISAHPVIHSVPCFRCFWINDIELVEPSDKSTIITFRFRNNQDESLLSYPGVKR